MWLAMKATGRLQKREVFPVMESTSKYLPHHIVRWAPPLDSAEAHPGFLCILECKLSSLLAGEPEACTGIASLTVVKLEAD